MDHPLKDRPLKKILLVEDDEHIRTLARMSLDLVGGFEVCACASAAAALEAVHGFAPDLLLLDVRMPGMDGPTLLLELRKCPDWVAVPVIFFTARTQPEEVDQLLALGAIEVIAKPFNPMTLADSVKAAWARVDAPL